MFYDIVEVKFIAGKGGNGIIASRREKYVSKGGPAGGNGGKGGNIILKADRNVNTLIEFRYKNIFKAEDGENGKGKEQNGKNGKDLILKVPIGTLVKSDEGIIYNFTKDGEIFIAARGGKGGLGNINFKNSVNQFPNLFLYGEPGEEKEYTLELQLYGDIGLIGYPNVGKSSLINAITNANVRVGNYPFTTKSPNLGICKIYDKEFVVVDIPGIIEGAHEGKGMGLEFLRHVLKSKIWILMIDILDPYGIERGIKVFNEILSYIDIYLNGEYKIINDKHTYIEINTKDYKLRKMILVVFNKIDQYNGDYNHTLPFYNDKIFYISTITNQNIKKLLDYIYNNINDLTDYYILNDVLINKKNEKYIKYLGSNIWLVKNDYLCYLLATVPQTEEGKKYFYQEIVNKKIQNWLINNGVKKGDIIKVISKYKKGDFYEFMF